MAKLDIFELVAKSEFPLHFNNRTDVQDTLEAARILGNRLLGDAYSQVNSEERRKMNLQRQRQRLTTIQGAIPSLEVLIESPKIDEVTKKRHRFELFEKVEEMQRLERELKGRNVGTLLMERFASHADKDFALALDAWALALAEWFTTGAVGEGEVKYKDKVYSTE